MTRFTPRTLALGALVAVLATGCNKSATDTKPAADAAKDPKAIPGLATDKQRAGYVLGMEIGQSLKPIKDEVDIASVEKAIRTTLDGGKPLMDEKQAQETREAFMQKVQAKRMAEQMAAAGKNLQAGKDFLARNGKVAGVTTTPSGLQYQVLKAGNGPKPGANDVVTVHYQGTLLDGTKFDSSYDRGQPAQIPLGQVVPGWREGIQLMPVGSKYRLWIPAGLGYGEAGTPGGPIPPNSTLVFDVELLGIGKPGAAPAGRPAG
ncbi:MAG: FKBP-type peptidyl-prolyl cis-trans isomerase [Lysobacter sp.]|nr:MAG: FKBP-type peptidyl-prolyl cis-trans isomerase [Lysobacter sp.]